MNTPPIVSPQAWETAREKLLIKEKEMTRARDALAAERRRMPWVAVEKDYLFEGPDGRVSLPDLFDGRQQLIVYRAFFEPGVHGWPEHACIGCSLGADQVSNLAHLKARDTALVYASRAPQTDIARARLIALRSVDAEQPDPDSRVSRPCRRRSRTPGRRCSPVRTPSGTDPPATASTQSKKPSFLIL